MRRRRRRRCGDHLINALVGACQELFIRCVLPLCDNSVRTDGRAAAGIENGQQHTLGRHRCARRRVVHNGKHVRQFGVAGAAFDRQRTLPRGGQHLKRVEHLGHGILPTDSGEPGVRENHTVEMPIGYLRQPGVDVAAYRHHIQLESQRTQLRGAARRAGPDLRTGRKPSQGQPVPRAQRITRVGAFRHRGQGQPFGRSGRQILQGVHREIDPAIQHRLAERVHEHTGSADAGQRLARHIAVGGDLDQAHIAAGGRGQRISDTLGLSQRQLAAPGTEPKRVAHA